MNSRSASLAVIAAGLALAASPWYWSSLVETVGVGSLAPSVAFPLTAGLIFVLLGGLARLLAPHERLRFDRIAVATLVAIAFAWVAVAATVAGDLEGGWRVVAPFLVGVGAVGAGFLVGAAPDGRRRLLAVGLGAALVLPYVARAAWLVAQGLGSTMHLYAAAGLVGGVVVVAVPLYLLGGGLDIAPDVS